MGPRIFGIDRAPAPRSSPFGPAGSQRLDASVPVGPRDALRTSPAPGSAARSTRSGATSSPDGRWFSYFALKASAEWELGPTYIVISRLPWLDGSRRRGDRQHLDARDAVRRATASSSTSTSRTCGDLCSGARTLPGCGCRAPHSFAVERRRGWTETPETPPRAADDAWDERRGGQDRDGEAAPERERLGPPHGPRDVRGDPRAARSRGRTSGTSTAPTT